jgi:nucleoside-diphosphate-sugar epimerase
VGDVVSAVLLAHRATTQASPAYNLATGDNVAVTEIAGLALDMLGFDPAEVAFEYTGGDRGWKGAFALASLVRPDQRMPIRPDHEGDEMRAVSVSEL